MFTDHQMKILPNLGKKLSCLEEGEGEFYARKFLQIILLLISSLKKQLQFCASNNFL
jgi:hypothetical protein